MTETFTEGLDLSNLFDTAESRGAVAPFGYGDTMSSFDNAPTNHYNNGKSRGISQSVVDLIIGQVAPQFDDRAEALRRRLSAWRK